MASALHHWLSEADYAAWHEVLERAVPHRYATDHWTSQWGDFFSRLYLTDPDHVGCLSMYIPVEGHRLNDYFPHCSWYRAAGWNFHVSNP